MNFSIMAIAKKINAGCLMRLLMKFCLLMVSFIVLSCATATGSVIITGQVRPAISPTDVRIFLDHPSQFETIGLVEASAELSSSVQRTQDLIIDELKKQAARIGANGVILRNIGNRSGGGVFVSGVFIPIEIRSIQGEAIYIIQE